MERSRFILRSQTESLRWVNVVQLIIEACVAIGYVLALIPFVYLWSSGWVIPLIVISLVLALINGNGTLIPSLINLAMALLSFIPVLGYVPRIIGILIALFNINTIRRRL